MALLSCSSMPRLHRSLVTSLPASRPAVVTVRATAGKPAGKASPVSEDKSSLGKGDIVDKVASETGLPKAVAAKAFDTLITIIEDALTDDKRVTIVGFGSFETRQRAERTGRNPKTGEPLKIAASKAPSFKASKALKDKLNGKAAPPKAKPAAPVKVPKAAKPASTPKPAVAPPAGKKASSSKPPKK